MYTTVSDSNHKNWKVCTIYDSNCTIEVSFGYQIVMCPNLYT